MSLSCLKIHQLRNIASAKLMLDSRYNVFCGQNGSGKTSVLESIYLLGMGQSFRTRDTQSLIQMGTEALTVYGELSSEDVISVQKQKGKTTVHFNQEKCQKRSLLAKHLPCQLFYQDIFEIIDSGPSVRRGILDFGLFYYFEDYHTVWNDLKRVLKQRNALLRRGCTRQHLAPWDEQLVSLSYQLHAFRVEYIALWFQTFQSYLTKLTNIHCEIDYYPGWDASKQSLDEILHADFEADVVKQYTQSGAHQADLIFMTQNRKAKLTLSRGQQKMVLIALKLAQATFLEKPCLYLFDDVSTELDESHLSKLFELLQSIQGQFFFTSIHNTLFKKLLQAQAPAYFQLQAGMVSRETEGVSV